MIISEFADCACPFLFFFGLSSVERMTRQREIGKGKIPPSIRESARRSEVGPNDGGQTSEVGPFGRMLGAEPRSR
jgi:hypothetical protein